MSAPTGRTRRPDNTRLPAPAGPRRSGWHGQARLARGKRGGPRWRNDASARCQSLFAWSAPLAAESRPGRRPGPTAAAGQRSTASRSRSGRRPGTTVAGAKRSAGPGCRPPRISQAEGLAPSSEPRGANPPGRKSFLGPRLRVSTGREQPGLVKRPVDASRRHDYAGNGRVLRVALGADTGEVAPP